jgi:Domain of unknown function (DUF4177)
MSIEVGCVCGRSFKAKDEHAGQKAKCPACGALLEIPSPSREPSPFPGELNVNDLHEGLEEDRVGVRREASLTDVWRVLNTISAQLGASSLSRSEGRSPEREYKVITQKDKWFSGKFDPEKVEGALNSYAKQGWTLKGVATATIPGFGGAREEIVIIMER